MACSGRSDPTAALQLGLSSFDDRGQAARPLAPQPCMVLEQIRRNEEACRSQAEV